MYERQLGCPVKKRRSDGGGEYVSNALQSFLCTKGIVHEKVPPYHPQQNGAAERLNKTLLDHARAMMLGALLPLSTWADILNAACFLRNRTPCSSIDWDLLYELFWKTPPPSLKQLRAYGCPAFVLNLGPGVKKLDARCLKGRLIGYAADGQLYRILLDGGRTVIVSKHVKLCKDGSSQPLTEDMSKLDNLMDTAIQPSKPPKNSVRFVY
jgi:hypothetical protein